MAPPPVLLHLNALTAFLSTMAAVVALRNPTLLSHTAAGAVGGGERFFRNLYAARALPFGIVVGAVPYHYRHAAGVFGGAGGGELVLAWLLFAASAVQAADVGIAVSRREGVVVVFAGTAAVVHALAGWAYL